jgi:hypothetical protein
MLVPFPRAASRRLISFLTFHISIYPSKTIKSARVLNCCLRSQIEVFKGQLTFFSASLACASAILGDVD